MLLWIRGGKSVKEIERSLARIDNRTFVAY